MSVGCDLRLVAFVLLPGNVTEMMVRNQYGPLSARFLMSGRLPRSPVDHSRSGLRFSECVSSGVDRIGQQLQNRVVDRQAPNRLPTGLIQNTHGYLYPLSPEPQQYLASATEFGHFGEDQSKRLLNSLVGIHFDFAIDGPRVPDRQTVLQFAAPGLLSNRLDRALTEEIQLELTHRAFEPEQKTVVNDAWIIDAVRVHHNGINHTAQFD